MNVCDLVTGSKRLQKATQALKEKWLETKEFWQDKTAEQFEREYLEPLGERLNLTFGAVNQLSEVLQSAEQDLDDRSSTGF